MNVNAEKLKVWGEAYLRGLTEAVERDALRPAEERVYGYDVKDVPHVASLMIAAIADHPDRVNYAGDGFRATCKILGIKATRRSVLEFLEVKR